MLAPPTETRICSHCGGEFPLDDFRRKARGSEVRHYACSNCHRDQMTAWRARRRTLRLRRGIRSIRSNAMDRRAMAVFKAMLARFGGVGGLVNEWTTAIRTAQAKDPGDRFVLDSFMTIARLHERAAAAKAEERGRRADELEAMSNDRLAAVVQKNVLAVIRENPQVAIEAARQLGWHVEPIVEGETAAQ